MGCGTEYCFYPGNKGNELYVGGRVENVGRCLAKRMESHKFICESFPNVFLCLYNAVVVFCSVVSAPQYV
jgi:hypothetical protein